MSERQGDPFFDVGTKADAVPLLRSFHYIGSQCAEPSWVFLWRRAGGLFGDCGEPCAAALFSPPAAYAWGRRSIELARLVRDETPMPPMTAFLSECLGFLRRRQAYDVVVSYADPAASHHGGVYQAGSWIYVGRSSSGHSYVHRETGVRSSRRTYDQSRYTEAEWDRVPSGRKYTYLFPLSRKARKAWRRKRMPYPKSIARGTCGSCAEEAQP